MGKEKLVTKNIIIIFLILVFLSGAFILRRNIQESDDSVQPESFPIDNFNENNNKNESNEIPKLPIWNMEDEFELPIIGAAGYASKDQDVFKEPNSNVIGELERGTPFEIKATIDEWWMIESESKTGWIRHETAFINLPDVIPSIIYKHTNSYDSKFKSSYHDIPGLTGESLNKMFSFNNRLDREMYIMPILYRSAKKIFEAQQLALAQGETLILYETYRPKRVQRLVNEALTNLSRENDEVKEGLTKKPWNMSWFISKNISNHQRGLAIDSSLGEIQKISQKVIGDYQVLEISEYTEYVMQTPIHELSVDSVVFKEPISSRDTNGWKELGVNPETTEASLRMQTYLIEAGFSPLASEWWHFNDIDAYNEFEDEITTGDFDITTTINSVPEWKDVNNNLK